MLSPDNLVLMYKELADWHERQGRPQMRDRFLVLAADAALNAGRPAEADLLLGRLLRANPHHMLRPFATFGEAMASPDVRNYVGELRHTHPPQQAEAEFDALRASRGAQAPARPTRALPATAPVEDADDEPAAGREPLKVYRVQDEAEAPAPPRSSRPPAAPTRPLPRPVRPVPLALPPLEVDPGPPVLPSPVDGEDTARGSWVSVVLFVLLLAAGLVLAGWTLLRPFLPPG
jgi:hypothetical protein